MDPDKAHRTLNTVLLVVLVGMLSVNNMEMSTWGDYLIGVSIYLSFLALVFIGIKIASKNMDAIREYLELA